MKNTIYTQKSLLDQFYTNPKIAAACYKHLQKIISDQKINLFLEPSAGNGSFYSLLPPRKRIGIDLDPQFKNVKKMNFFDYSPPNNKNILTVGNPPFGKNASLAIAFFNKAADFSKIIAFIVPKTFRKQSVHKKLNKYFHLILDLELPPKSFLLNNKEYDVPCCFQIWKKNIQPRIIPKYSIANKLFEFVSKNEAQFAIRRVGGRAGKATIIISDLTESSHYFLKLINKNIEIPRLIKEINDIDFTLISTATAGVKSISKMELIESFKNNLYLKEIM